MDIHKYISFANLYIMIAIIFSLLVLTHVNCDLAAIWLNNQLFKCAQITGSYNEVVKHQYMCISSLTWICARDVNAYTPGSVLSLDYFCGFINVQNAKQSPTIWNIHVRPNIHVHFLKFSLFHNYWYCDFEYIRITTTSKTSTFCGNRLPWIHDASDVSVSISLSTQRFGSKHIQVELQYYGAYAQSYQHFVVFMEHYSISNSRLPDRMQNRFETFHFISSSKLDILNFTAVNMCRKTQLICHDGPGIKAPTLQFMHNQSTYKCVSSTFQMYCEFLVTDIGCVNGPQFHYHATRAEGEFIRIFSPPLACVDEYNIPRKNCINPTGVRLRINESVSKGPTKYMYKHNTSILTSYDPGVRTFITINVISISFPYMIYEGLSCMYGGIYMIDTLSSNVFETFSHCDPGNIMNGKRLDFSNVVIIIIHYIEYSGSSIIFDAQIENVLISPTWPVNLKLSDTKSVNITLDRRFLKYMLKLYSIMLDHRSIRYIFVTVDKEILLDKTAVNVTFDSWNDLCTYCTLIYPSFVSNIKGRQYDVEVLHGAFKRKEIIQSISINTGSCNAFTIPMWSVSIQLIRRIHDPKTFEGINTTSTVVLSNLAMWRQYQLQEGDYQVPFWYMVHMIKPGDVPPYAIWRVWMEACFLLSHVALEVPTDKHFSTSVYKWNHFNNNYNVYMTIDAVVNLLFESDNMTIPNESCQDVFKVWFRRHFIYDDRITPYVPGHTSEESFFTFHNTR